MCPHTDALAFTARPPECAEAVAILASAGLAMKEYFHHRPSLEDALLARLAAAREERY